MRAHIETGERPAEPSIELLVDLVQHREVQPAAADHGLVRKDQELVPGIPEPPGRFRGAGLDLQLVQALHRVRSVAVEHSVPIEQNYPVANLKHFANAAERVL